MRRKSRCQVVDFFPCSGLGHELAGAEWASFGVHLVAALPGAGGSPAGGPWASGLGMGESEVKIEKRGIRDVVAVVLGTGDVMSPMCEVL